MKARKLTASEVTFTVTCLPEDTDYRGNAMASGDDAADRETEEWIRKELDRGNEWAWCIVEVTAVWTAPNGETFTGRDILGGVSANNEKDFTVGNSDYFDDMRVNALQDLNNSIERIAESIPV